VVGQQVTLTSTNSGVANPRIGTLITRAGTAFTSLTLGGVVTECDLVVKGTQGGVSRGWLREPGGLFRNDVNATISDAALRALAGSDGPLTYTCVPPGSGHRLALDRDLDTLFNGVETNTGTFVDANDTGTNPALTDTDGDGFDDDVEVNGAPPTDPNDPLDFPGAPVPALSLLGVGILATSILLAAAFGTRRRMWGGRQPS
jgi:hypothetical protein